MNKAHLILLWVAFLPFVGCKQAPLESRQLDTFTKFYGTSDLEIGYDLKTTVDGGYILAGTQTTASGSDIFVVKTDRFGNQEWTKNIGGVENESASAIVIDAEGNYVVAGYQDLGSGNKNVYVVKFSESGVIWEKSFGGSNKEEAYDIVLTNDGGYAISGCAMDATGDLNALLIKIDGMGNESWTKDFGATGADWATSLIEKADGGFVLGCTTNSYGGAGLSNANFMLVETNAIGDEVDRATFGSTLDNLNLHIAIDPTNNRYVVAGTNVNTSQTSSQIYYATFNQSNLHSAVSSAIISDDAFDSCADLVVDAENNLLITGNRDLAPAGSAERQFSTLFVAIAGNEITDETVGSNDASNQTGHSIVETLDGRVAIVGSNDEVSLSGMMTLIKLSKTGQLNQ